MKIQASYNQHIDVDIDEYQRKRIVLEYLYEKFDWNGDYQIIGAEVIEVVEYSGSHRYDVKEYIRDATDMDKMIYNLCREIKHKT